MNPKTVLFVCTHNSARSQMAEAWLNHIGGPEFRAESAGLEPGTLNPFVVEAMSEAGIDISHQKTKAVFDLFKAGRIYNYVITVCDSETAERCPVFPGIATREHWSFPDPSLVNGTDNEKLAQARTIRDRIRDKVNDWCEQMLGAVSAR